MKVFVFISLLFFCSACTPESKNMESEKSGTYSGLFEYGDFSDLIQFDIEQDSSGWNVFFTSLQQNARNIPVQSVQVQGDSISFLLRSDFYTYQFQAEWINQNTQLLGFLSVDTIQLGFVLDQVEPKDQESIKEEEVSFESQGIEIHGTIRSPGKGHKKGLVLLTSSGNSDRSASIAEAILFAKKGYTTFVYDKQGTGKSQGDWTSANMEDLIRNDIQAIEFFSTKTGIPFASIGIKGSSQGAAKIPTILNELSHLKYGIVVSCPGGSLLESDLNYWKNRNAEALGNNLQEAAALQRKVFEHIAGSLTRTDLKNAIKEEESKPWFSQVWIPELDQVQIDQKLQFDPIPHFKKTKQALLVLQGSLDEIIPPNSHERISEALDQAGNTNYQVLLLEGASHSMYQIGESDFPYWSKLHRDYLTTMVDWISSISDQ